ncbi:MAG: hypothetical protein MPW14_11830 [Candidatus Manganitrophus sp.]|nr:MAG: hypothetical protein MPW14_11830 [Candidatus Manganitrophus sp.]
MKLHRVAAIIQRHLYLYQRSLPRMTEVFFWPLIDLLLWGFVTLYLQRFQENLPKFVTFFLGALILWDILYRAQQGISVSFLEEVWSKNLLNLFVTPMRPSEFLAALMSISVLKLLTAGFASAFLAWFLYSFNVFVLGVSLLPFVLNLAVMGWSIGIFTMASILRYGQEAEVMAWGLAFLVQPISAVLSGLRHAGLGPADRLDDAVVSRLRRDAGGGRNRRFPGRGAVEGGYPESPLSLFGPFLLLSKFEDR